MAGRYGVYQGRPLGRQGQGQSHPALPVHPDKKARAASDEDIKIIMVDDPLIKKRMQAQLRSRQVAAKLHLENYEDILTLKSAAEPQAQIDMSNFTDTWWLLTTKDDWQNATAIHFFYNSGANKYQAKLFTGTPTYIRELTSADQLFWSNPTVVPAAGAAVDVCDVVGISATAIRFLNVLPYLSKENLTSTFTIQPTDSTTGWAVLWSEFDGMGDDPANGFVETAMRYSRLPAAPQIQYNSAISAVDWNTPTNLFKYLKDYEVTLGNPQTSPDVKCTSWIGYPAYDALYQQMLTSGITRTIKSSHGNRGGKYIGIWKTQNPSTYPVTTIHTDGVHYFTPCSTVAVSGLLGEYSVG